MRYMILVKATKDTEAGVMPTEDEFAEMLAYHEELANAGVFVDGSGLQASSKGWRIRYDGQQRIVTDGPFTETKELVAGYTIIRVDTPEDAREWSLRFPNPSAGGGKCEIEVRRLFDLDDFGEGETIERFRELESGS